MKSLRILLGLVIVGNVISATSRLNIKDYFTGSGIDKEGKTLRHRYAENCEDIDAFKRFLTSEAIILRNQNAKLDVALLKEPLSVFIKDNNGQTALDIAREMYKKTGNSACLLMAIEIYNDEMNAKIQK